MEFLFKIDVSDVAEFKEGRKVKVLCSRSVTGYNMPITVMAKPGEVSFMEDKKEDGVCKKNEWLVSKK